MSSNPVPQKHSNVREKRTALSCWPRNSLSVFLHVSKKEIVCACSEAGCGLGGSFPPMPLQCVQKLSASITQPFAGPTLMSLKLTFVCLSVCRHLTQGLLGTVVKVFVCCGFLFKIGL